MRRCIPVVLLAVLGMSIVPLAQVQDLDIDCVMPRYIVADDLNKDGYPDLAVACHSCNTVTLLQNLAAEMPDPCAAFDVSMALDWQLDDAPMAIAAGDFLDEPLQCPRTKEWYFPYYSPFPSIVAVSQYQPGLVRVSPIEHEPPMRNLVDGSIEVERLGGAFATLNHVALGDLTNNGVLDVVVLDGVTPKLGVFTGGRDPIEPVLEANTSTQKSPDTIVDLANYHRAYHVALADMNRDGLLDLVVAADGKVLFFQNEYTPQAGLSFTLQAEVTVGTHVAGLAIADFNRDGYLDVAAVDPEFGALSIVRNKGCWDLRLEQRLKLSGGPVAVVALDCTRTGLVDLAVAQKESDQITIVMNRLRGTEGISRPDACDWSEKEQDELVDRVEFIVSHSYSVGKDPIDLAAADFNQNGILDLAVALHGGGPSGVGPAVQIIYNPCCCPTCDGTTPCCADADCHRDVCPELVGVDPKG